MSVSLPPSVIKGELESLLSQAMQTSDGVAMEDLFHIIVDKSNNLRQRYGIPVRASEKHYLSVLKTPTEQLHAAGVGNETVMGHAVYARASADPRDSKDNQLCLFDQCFLSDDKSNAYRDGVLVIINEHTDMKDVKIYPPLILRAAEDTYLRFHVDMNSKVRRPTEALKTNLVFVLFVDGPIIPVLNKEDHNIFQSMIHVIYSLAGTTDANSLERTLLA
jgi:hypothetical protein